MQHFPNSELPPHRGGTAQTGSLCTLQLPSPWRSSTSPRCGQCSSLSVPGHSTLLSSAAPPGSSGTPSSPGHRAARRPGGTGVVALTCRSVLCPFSFHSTVSLGPLVLEAACPPRQAPRTLQPLPNPPVTGVCLRPLSPSGRSIDKF